METSFWLLMSDFNFSCMIACNTLFDSRGWVFRDKVSSEDIAEINGLCHVAKATNFGTTLTANGLWREITRSGFRIKDGLFSVNPASVGCSLWIHRCGVWNCSRRATVRLGIDTLIANILVCVNVMM